MTTEFREVEGAAARRHSSRNAIRTRLRLILKALGPVIYTLSSYNSLLVQRSKVILPIYFRYITVFDTA